MRLPLFVLTVLPVLPLEALCLAPPAMAQDVSSSSADWTSNLVTTSLHKRTTHAAGTADAISSTANVAGKTIDFMKDATSFAGKYSGDIKGTATATKFLGGFVFGLNGISDVSRVYSAGQKEGRSGAARETAQIATEEGAKTALTTSVAMATGEAAGGPLSITACAAFEVGLWCRDHTALGEAIQNAEYHAYVHITGKDAPMQLSQTTGPAAYTKQRLLQALKDAGITPNFTPSSDSTTAARIGPRAGPRSSVDLLGPLKAAGMVGTPGPQSGSANLMGPLRSAGLVTPTAPETPRSQAAALAAGLTAWNQQQAELKREQEEAIREAAEERQEQQEEQQEEQARVDRELSEDTDDNNGSDSDDPGSRVINPATGWTQADEDSMILWDAEHDDDSTDSNGSAGTTDDSSGVFHCVVERMEGLPCANPSHDARPVSATPP